MKNLFAFEIPVDGDHIRVIAPRDLSPEGIAHVVRVFDNAFPLLAESHEIGGEMVVHTESAEAADAAR